MADEQSQIDVSIVIVSFNTRDILRRCLDAVARHADKLRQEIIVVDNDSRDGSQDMVECEFPHVRLIRNTQNLMFARASNQGMAAASGRNLLLLNSDAFVGEGTTRELAHFLDRNSLAAAVGPKVLNLDGSLQSKGFSAPRIGLGIVRVTGLNKMLPDYVKRRIFATYFWDENKAVMPDVLSGCCMMLKASAAHRIGGLCEDFYHGGEDGEWCFRARRFGYQVWYLPAAVVEHVGGASKVRLDSTITIRDTVRMWELSFGVAYGLVAESIDIIYDLQRYASALLTRKEPALRAQIRAKARLQCGKIAALVSRVVRDPRRAGPPPTQQ